MGFDVGDGPVNNRDLERDEVPDKAEMLRKAGFGERLVSGLAGTDEIGSTPELRAKQAENWAAERIAELNQRLAQQIDSKFNTGSVLKDIGRTVLLACAGFAIVALAWSLWK